MKHALPDTLALIALGLAMFIVTPAHAQTTAPGPYYATPSWDQTLPSSTRFIVLTNMNSEAVLDRETGLVWQRTPNQTSGSILGFAQTNCFKFTPGGRAGWRVPTMPELLSIFVPQSCTIDGFPGQFCLGLPDGHPFIVPNGVSGSWSTTLDHASSPAAYLTLGLFQGALIFLAVQADFSDPVWCVRGPSPSGGS